jgi:methyl-accepting chemotaxis protein
MVLAALWLQSGEVSGDYVKWLTVFVGILAFALLFQALGMVFFAMRAVSAMKDLKSSLDEAKVKALPMMGNIYDITLTTQGILTDLAPKIKVISENVTEISHTVRQTVGQLDSTLRQTAERAAVTFDDANFRTQRQVARVDAMVASTLAATSEIGATIHEGIRVPIRKITEVVAQSKHLIDNMIGRAKAVGAGLNAYINHVKPTEKHEDINRVDW